MTGCGRDTHYTMLEISGHPPMHPPYMGGWGVFEGCFKALRYDLSILGYTDWKSCRITHSSP